MKIIDVTLRDGGHAVKFNWSLKLAQDLYSLMSKVKNVQYVELGYWKQKAKSLNKFYDLEDYRDANNRKIYSDDGETMFSNKLNPDLFMVSTGISNNDFTKLVSILESIECNWICIDIANGYINDFSEFCKKVRQQFPEKIIVAGNVVTREMVEQLILDCGVDVCKVGLGNGSVCSTRLKTGVGMPQLSAILECADAAHGVNGHIISDGGITCPGDMAKAFGAGADFVMTGGQFAGHDQNPGEVVTIDGKKYKQFYGMSSDAAQEKHFGKMEKYRSSEGRVLNVPYKGDLNNTVLDFLGGIRSACTYINAQTIKQMPKCTTFVRVSQQVNTVFL